jgi:ADP-dependent NAD(P)H-hydrate dehydratase / NAD(P)H-hydrate epimerase
MKILLSPQIKEADAYTIKNEPIPSIDLMERASKEFFNWLVQRFDYGNRFVVFSGPGNNGGDGLAIARLLAGKGYHVSVNIVRSSQKGSPDFLANLEQIKNILPVINEITASEQIPVINKTDIVIDAMFGSGLDRPVEGIFAEVIGRVNQVKPTVVAVDIASGLFSDKKTEGDTIMKVDYTISFQVPKLAFFMRQNYPYVGEWIVVDIGLDLNFIDSLDSPYFTIDKSLAAQALPRRDKFSHKGNFGRTIIFSGSRGKMGAAILSARACLRTGVGLLTVHVPEYGSKVMQMSVPEAMVTIDPSVECFSEPPDLDLFDSMGIGPGLGTNKKTIQAFKELLKKADYPVVIDADGINMLGIDKDLLRLLPENTILTPHPKEFERIAGETADDFETIERQRQMAMRHKLYIILKGAHSSVATPEGKVFFNTTGNPGIATAGSGDVLTGMTTSLLAQSKNPFLAAVSSVYLHGLAGNLAALKTGEESLIASDIIDHIPAAIRELRQGI